MGVFFDTIRSGLQARNNAAAYTATQLANADALRKQQGIKALGEVWQNSTTTNPLPGEMGPIMPRNKTNQEMLRESIAAYPDLALDYFKGQVGTTMPSKVREHLYYMNLPEDQRESYDHLIRANQFQDYGGYVAQYDPHGRVVGYVPKTLLPSQEIPYIENVEKSKVVSKAEAESGVEAYDSGFKSQQMISVIDDLLTDPDLGSVVGGVFGIKGRLSKMSPDGEGWTEAQRRLQPLIKELSGQKFLKGFGDLKGGGQITEIEGQQGNDSITSLSQAQSLPDFKNALQRLRAIVALGQARKEAGINLKDPVIIIKDPANAQYIFDLLPSGKRFIDPDGVERVKP